MRFTIPATVVLLLLMSFPPTVTAGPLRMEFGDGYVTISASEVPLRQVLTEWARLGHTRIVNAEKLGGALLTLELSHVPEKQALEIVLRSVPGYLIAQRTITAAPGLSQFDRIVVMPGTVAPAAARTVAPPPPPAMQPPPPMPAMAVEDQDEPVQNTPEPGETAEQEQPQPLTLPQPGVQPMPPAPQGQNEQGGVQQPSGPVMAPGRGAVISPTPGQLPVPPPKPQDQQDQ